MIQILKKPELTKEMGIKGKKRVHDLFSTEVFTKSLVTLVEDMLQTQVNRNFRRLVCIILFLIFYFLLF